MASFKFNHTHQNFIAFSLNLFTIAQYSEYYILKHEIQDENKYLL